MTSSINFGTNLAVEFAPLSILDRGAMLPEGLALAALVQGSLSQINRSTSSSASPPDVMGRQVFSLRNCLGLSPSEDLLLQILFKRWHLAQGIVLLTLFGTDLHSKISSLANYLPKEAVDHLIGEFFRYFFCIYNIYDRDNAIFPDRQPGITEKYFSSIPIIKKKLLQLKTEISKSISTKNMIEEISSLTTKKAEKRRPPKIAAKIDERYETAKRLEKSIGDTVDLIIKILEHKNGAHVLLKMPINTFEGTENRHPPSLENTHLALDHLSAYANYCASVMHSAKKGEVLSIGMTPFWQAISNLSLQASPLPTQEKISQIREHLHRATIHLADQISLNEEEIVAAQTGELTHANWLIQTGSHSRKSKPQNEFIESLILRKIEIATHDFLISQFWSIFESQVIAPAYPDFSPLRYNMRRLVGCISWYPSITQKEMIPSPSTLTERFQNYFSELITEIEDEYKEDAVLGDEKKYIKQLDVKAEGSDLSFWINTLTRLDYPTICAQLNEMKHKLAAIPAKLTQFLEEEKKALPPDISVAELKQIASEIQEICLSKSLSLTCIVMVMEDADTIVHGRFVTGPKHIPQELADIIILDWVEELLESPTPLVEAEVEAAEALEISSPVPEQPISQTVEELLESPTHLVEAEVEAAEALESSSPVPDQPISQIADEVQKSAAAKPVARAVQARPAHAHKVQQEVPRKRPYSPVPQAIRSLTKVDKVIAMLKAHGFTEKRQGPHRILADEAGHVVPIPRGSKGQKRGLPKGTLQAIFEQATRPLEQKE